jgi:hypothetical protein
MLWPVAKGAAVSGRMQRSYVGAARAVTMGEAQELPMTVTLELFTDYV